MARCTLLCFVSCVRPFVGEKGPWEWETEITIDDNDLRWLNSSVNVISYTDYSFASMWIGGCHVLQPDEHIETDARVCWKILTAAWRGERTHNTGTGGKSIMLLESKSKMYLKSVWTSECRMVFSPNALWTKYWWYELLKKVHPIARNNSGRHWTALWTLLGNVH